MVEGVDLLAGKVGKSLAGNASEPSRVTQRNVAPQSHHYHEHRYLSLQSQPQHLSLSLGAGQTLVLYQGCRPSIVVPDDKHLEIDESHIELGVGQDVVEGEVVEREEAQGY